MANDRPDPGEFLDMAQRMLRELFGGSSGGSSGEEEPWAEATRPGREFFSKERHHEPSAERQRENLTFALATRAVEALEDVALNVAAIRQRLERTASPVSEVPASAPEEPASAPEEPASAPEAPEDRHPTVEQPPGNPDPGAF
jgi:hypothetical protein